MPVVEPPSGLLNDESRHVLAAGWYPSVTAQVRCDRGMATTDGTLGRKGELRTGPVRSDRGGHEPPRRSVLEHEPADDHLGHFACRVIPQIACP